MVLYEPAGADGQIAASRVDDAGYLLGEPDPDVTDSRLNKRFDDRDLDLRSLT